ncbi:alpha-ketoglutarate-dependent dioxygenase AlkB [Kordiimonas sp.]|uniref:alpha-ketoglutarate-dependent dioxygenase AlkB n=1 Tax=Kordiimonas sp. TaxID=1970157 RepID=UPI003A90C338
MDLFTNLRPEKQTIRDGVTLLASFADTNALLREIPTLLAVSPVRRMLTPGGRQMQVAMSNCGPLGWVSEPTGYRYAALDPLTGNPWPAMPERFRTLARAAAERGGFMGFEPDACLINEYTPGVKLSPHIDQDEADKNWPIVSVSIGIPAVFQLYGLTRGGSAENIPLYDGDAIVFGGPARHVYHGVKKVERASDARIGEKRINLTFRKAL